MPKGKPALRITYGEPAAEYAAVIAKELKDAGFRVTLAKGVKFLGTFSSGGANNFVEIQQAISDVWPYVVPFIPIIWDILKKATRKKRRKGDKTTTRVKVIAKKDEMVMDFNDHQLAKREPDPAKPMALPDVSEMIEVPDEPETKPAARRSAKKATAKKAVKMPTRKK